VWVILFFRVLFFSYLETVHGLSIVAVFEELLNSDFVGGSSSLLYMLKFDLLLLLQLFFLDV